jgi:hypothetical protein
MTTAKHHQLEVRARVRSSASGQLLVSRSIADPEAAQDLAAFRKRITRSPEAAKEYLQGVGILTPRGKLTRRYGGK